MRNLRDPNIPPLPGYPVHPEGELVYRGPSYAARRARLLERCGHKCERCRVPDKTTVLRAHLNSWAVGGFWWSPDGTPRWKWENVRSVTISLAMTHLTHDSLRNDDADLAIFCQYCHLNYDLPQHKETREIHKDERRPLLVAMDSVSLSEIVRRFGEQFEAAAQGALHGSL
jgi:hypothetical protein